MWARRAGEDIFVTGSGTGGQMARRGIAIRGGANSEQGTAAYEKNECTARAVHRESWPWREGWRAVPPTLPSKVRVNGERLTL